MGTAIAIAILAIACSGYLTMLCFWPFRIHALRSDSQRLIYLSSSVGFVCLVAAFLLSATLPTRYSTWLADHFGLTYLDQFAWAFLLGPLLAFLLNWISVLVRFWNNPDESTFSVSQERERILMESLQKSGDMLMPLMVRCFERGTLLQVNLKSRKVYCGTIMTKPFAIWRTPTHISLFAKFSTYRNKDTLLWEPEKISYPIFEKYSLDQRLNVIDRLLPRAVEIEATRLANVSDNPANAISVKQLREEKRKIESLLRNFEGFELEDWIKLLPVDQIESISPFDEEAYERWFSKKTLKDVSAIAQPIHSLAS